LERPLEEVEDTSNTSGARDNEDAGSGSNDDVAKVDVADKGSNDSAAEEEDDEDNVDDDVSVKGDNKTDDVSNQGPQDHVGAEVGGDAVSRGNGSDGVADKMADDDVDIDGNDDDDSDTEIMIAYVVVCTLLCCGSLSKGQANSSCKIWCVC
jgi:hypothetical protein